MKFQGAVLAIAVTGCATLFSGSATVPVATNPPGAVVYVNGQPAGQTPTVVVLQPNQPANIQIYLPGFQPVQMWRSKSFSGWFWANLLFWPGFFVDLATGKYEHYNDTPIAIGLVPSQGPPPEWYQQPPPPGYPEQPGYPQQPPPPGPAPVQPGQIPQVPLNPQVPQAQPPSR